ncbi:hypothetical protein PN498_13300 [Oscillatoria sp. CS-180]|uniref:hypothetical protein n=1 Tax=Oscillatoria sp. CS-180 TaxID=3021720 RepID=UPI00232F5342|nr:hypothetical protein [Oscillatoria sp. CS-180]MDB9526970.1 hypothetical protein [Oscillatoria sp. CS-180]
MKQASKSQKTNRARHQHHIFADKLFISTLTFCTFIFSPSLFHKASALPGQSPTESMRLINNNLGGIADFEVERYGSAEYYRAELTYGNSPLSIMISSPSSVENDYSEGIGIRESDIGNQLITSDFNPRQDEDILYVIQQIWGSEVVEDFVGSRYTARYYDASGPTYRNTYRGNKFGYIVRLFNDSKIFSLSIYSLQDFDQFRSKPNEFEEIL